MNDRAIFRILVLRRAHTHTYSGIDYYTKISIRRNYTIFQHRRKRTKTVFD